MDEPLIDEEAPSSGDLAETLRAAGLPVDDLGEPGRRFFRFRDREGRLIGFIGWEAAGEAAVLLRSLVVVPEMRGQGWSRAMSGWAILQAAEAGMTDAYVLTTTIEPLAAKLGFCRIDRSQAPRLIRTSRQFSSLCPSTAILMHRSLP